MNPRVKIIRRNIEQIILVVESDGYTEEAPIFETVLSDEELLNYLLENRPEVFL